MCSSPAQILLYQPTPPSISMPITEEDHAATLSLYNLSQARRPGAPLSLKIVVGLTSVHKFGPCMLVAQNHCSLPALSFYRGYFWTVHRCKDSVKKIQSHVCTSTY